MGNDKLCVENPEGLFATVFIAVLDQATGEVLFANGGHNPPVVLGADGAKLSNPDTGEALGLFDDLRVKNETITLAPEEGLLLYTDGVTEAIDVQRAFFGTDRLITVLDDERQNHSGSHMCADDVLDAVKRSVDDFSAGADQFDDMTMAVIMLHSTDEDRSLPAAAPFL